MAAANDIRKGAVLMEGNDLFLVLDCQHRTPGNLRAFVQATLRNIKTGISHDRRMRSTDKVEFAELETREMEYLYPEGENYCFMDTETYDQMFVQKDLVASSIPYLRLNDKVKMQMHQGKPVTIDLPASVILKVAESEPGVRGNTATNVFKPAKLETGLEVKVPLFVNPGEYVKIDTRTGEFIERANAPQ